MVPKLKLKSLALCMSVLGLHAILASSAYSISFVDLHMTSGTAPLTISNQQSFQVSWHVVNEGNTTTSGGWTDYLYFSTDATLDGSDQLLLTAPGTSPLDPGSSYTLTRTLTLPNHPSGIYYLIVLANASASLTESNANNNTVAIPITIQTVDLVTAPLHPLADVSSGESFQLSWAVQNLGDGKPQGAWTDYVHLSTDSTLDGSDPILFTQPVNPPLDPGTSVTLTHTVNLPNRPPGTYYLIVNANASNSVYEANYGNNTQAIPITIRVPDLVTAPLQPLADINSGQSFQMSWAVQNLGDGKPQSAWTDYVFLSTDSTLDGSDLVLFTQPVNPPLDPGTSVTLTHAVNIPNRPPGTYYLIVETNASNSIYEANYGNNTQAIPITIRVADLVLAPLQALPDVSSGQSFQLGWNAQNAGNGKPQNAWTDYIFLSTDAVLDGGDLVLLTQAGNPPLDPGTSYTQTRTVSLPNRPAGTYYLIVEVNASNSLYESDISNNTQAIPITIRVPNLVMIQTTATLQATSGQALPFSWHVTNAGDGKPQVGWTDYIFLSADATLDGADTILATAGVAPPLDPGTSYTLSRNLNLPNRPPGSYYIIVQANASATVYETTTTDNVQAVPVQINVPDIKPRSIKIWQNPRPGTAQTSFWVTWDATNEGDGAAYPSWTDYLYLSTDNQLDSGDSVLATANYGSRVEVQGIYGNAAFFTVPANTPDSVYVILSTNASASIFESDATNNTMAVPLYKNSAGDWSRYR